MVRYSPVPDIWAEPLATLRRVQEEINRAFGEQRWVPATEFPPINVWRGDEGVVVTAEVPGVKLEDIDLTVHQNTLTIKGKRTADAPEQASFHRRERAFGSFARSITLPYGVDPEQVKASCENGILSVRLPRPESDKPRKIKINQV